MPQDPNSEQPTEDGSNPLRQALDGLVNLYGPEQVLGHALDQLELEPRAQFLAEHFSETVKVAAFTPSDEKPDTTTVAGEVHALVARRGVGNVLKALLDVDRASATPGAIDLGGLVAGIARSRGYMDTADAAMNLLSVETLAQLMGTKYVKSTRRAAQLLPDKDRAETGWDLLENQGRNLADWIRSLDGPDQDTALGQLQQLYIERMLLGPAQDNNSLTHWLRALGKRYDAMPVARDALLMASISQQLEVLATVSPTVLGQALQKLSSPQQVRLLTLLQHEVKKSGPEGVSAAVRRVADVYGRLKVAKAACGDLSTEEGRELLKSWDPRDPIFDGEITGSVKKALDTHGVKLADVVLNQIEDGALTPIILRRLSVVPNEPEGTEKRLVRQEVEEALLGAMFRPQPGRILPKLESPETKWMHPMATFRVVHALSGKELGTIEFPVQELAAVRRIILGDARYHVQYVDYTPAMPGVPEQRTLVVREV